MNKFVTTLEEHGLELIRGEMKILQVNIGKKCNQACHHCHVEAGPKRTEMMEWATMEKILSLLETSPAIETVDITGGAPELNQWFRPFVEAIRAQGKGVIDRCNLTVLFEPNQEDTAEFLAKHKIEVVASLPCYQEDNVDKQRGKGVFQKSIAGLTKLNQLGYGKAGSGLVLNLVYNPVGEHLPPAQASLEQDYRHFLKDEFGIVFNNLFTITNMPIKRFAHALIRDGKMADYMNLLVNSFNPQAAQDVMCKSLVSVGWDGQIYDCDFNQMLEMPLNWKPRSIFEVDNLRELEGNIALDDHCFGCTAGAGSSCGGALL